MLLGKTSTQTKMWGLKQKSVGNNMDSRKNLRYDEEESDETPYQATSAPLSSPISISISLLCDK